jgi:S-adenosylmethionine uptake transporter
LKYFKAIFWFTLSLIVSCGNDAITKYLGNTLNPWEITFFRFAFGILSLVPVMLYQGRTAFITHRWKLHFLRGLFVFVAISLWSQGIKVSPITTSTLMSFTVPIFVLVLAPLFLKERVTWPMWLATLGGFVGILFVLQPDAHTFNQGSLFFIIAAVLFGMLDVLNKKYVTQEPILCMLFYSTLVASVLVILPAMQVWRTPTSYELMWLFVLGIGSNLILYFILLAFSLADASSLAPFRYIELLISMVVGYVFFHELPSSYSYLGAAIIIPSTLFIGYYQTRNRPKL